MFCEFCGSALHLLINKLNVIDPSGNIYGLVLLAQKRDNKQYKTQINRDVVYSGETYIDENNNEIFVQYTDRKTKELIKEKQLNGYHPDISHANARPFDGYDFNFKFFGYIYRQGVLQFNLEQTTTNLDNLVRIRTINQTNLHLDRYYANGIYKTSTNYLNLLLAKSYELITFETIKNIINYNIDTKYPQINITSDKI